MNVSPPPPGSPPPAYRRIEPMIVLPRDLESGRLPTTQDAWERPPARRTCWQYCCEDPCDGEADSRACFALFEACCRVVGTLCCVLACGD